VRVDDVRRPAPHHGQRRADQPVLEGLRPCEQALRREVQRDRVDRGTPHAHPVVDAVGQAGAAARHHAYLMPVGGELARERVDVPAQTTHDQRRVLP
jgi:hypothetical protein